MAITDIIEESEMIDTGAPSIKYEGERPLKKQEMLMAGPDWYIKRMELLMDEYGYGYDEAGEIAYDSDKYYEVIGIDPGGIGDESRNMDEEVVEEEGIMRAAKGGRVAFRGGGADASTTSFSKSFDKQHGTNTVSSANKKEDRRQAEGQRQADETNRRIAASALGQQQTANTAAAIKAARAQKIAKEAKETFEKRQKEIKDQQIKTAEKTRLEKVMDRRKKMGAKYVDQYLSLDDPYGNKDDSEAIMDMFVNYPKTQDQSGIGMIKGLEGLFDAGAVKTRKFFSGPTKDIFGRDQKGVLAAGKFNYKGEPLTAERFSEMGLTERNKAYKDYMGQRSSGQIDAYGNLAPGLRRETIPHRKADGTIEYREVIMGEKGGGGGDTYIPPISSGGSSSGSSSSGSDSDEEEEDFELGLAFRKDGGMARERAAFGGMIGLDGRRAYGLGSIFKKAKKIFKSPLGKAALLGLGGYKMGLFGSGNLGGILSGIKSKGLGKYLSGLSTGKVAGAIGGISLATALLSPPVDEDNDGYDDKTGFDVDEWRKKGAQGSQDVSLAFRAEGGDAESGLMNLGGMEKDYRADGGFVPIGKKEKADDVPARLSKNEFVFTADAVRNAGEGDIDKGAEVMYNMMKNLESGGDVSEESQGLDGAREMFQTSQRLEEVL